MRWDKHWLLAVSDLLINLSAGWFALVVITPNVSFSPIRVILTPTLINLVFGIFSLWVAVKMRKLATTITYE